MAKKNTLIWIGVIHVVAIIVGIVAVSPKPMDYKKIHASLAQECTYNVRVLLKIALANSTSPGTALPASVKVPTMDQMKDGWRLFHCPAVHQEVDDGTRSDYIWITDVAGGPIPSSEMRPDTPVIWDKQEHVDGTRSVGFWNGEIKTIMEPDFGRLMKKTRSWADQFKAARETTSHPAAATTPPSAVTVPGYATPEISPPPAD